MKKYIRVVTCQLLDRITFIRIINRIYLQSTDQISNQSLPFEPAHNSSHLMSRGRWDAYITGTETGYWLVRYREKVLREGEKKGKEDSEININK